MFKRSIAVFFAVLLSENICPSCFLGCRVFGAAVYSRQLLDHLLSIPTLRATFKRSGEKIIVLQFGLVFLAKLRLSLLCLLRLNVADRRESSCAEMISADIVYIDILTSLMLI